MPHKCASCCAPATLQCSGCQSAWYCSPKCQVAEWKAHKQPCKEAKHARRARKAERAAKSNKENAAPSKTKALMTPAMEKSLAAAGKGGKGGKRGKGGGKKGRGRLAEMKEANAAKKVLEKWLVRSVGGIRAAREGCGWLVVCVCVCVGGGGGSGATQQVAAAAVGKKSPMRALGHGVYIRVK